jgi:hypothetical protein
LQNELQYHLKGLYIIYFHYVPGNNKTKFLLQYIKGKDRAAHSVGWLGFDENGSLLDVNYTATTKKYTLLGYHKNKCGWNVELAKLRVDEARAWGMTGQQAIDTVSETKGVNGWIPWYPKSYCQEPLQLEFWPGGGRRRSTQPEICESINI